MRRVAVLVGVLAIALAGAYLFTSWYLVKVMVSLDARKSDEQILAAVEQLAEYAEVDQRVILDEMRRRGLTQSRHFQEYLKAAQQGDVTAQHDLGLLYAAGLDVEQDYGEALKWWRKAAEQKAPTLSTRWETSMPMATDGKPLLRTY